MLVEEYIHIAMEEFPYLFDQYGFKVSHTYQGEGRDVGRYAFGAVSGIYRMKMYFYRQQGEGLNYLGPLSAPYFTHEFSYEQQWVPIANLLWYLDRRHIDWSELLPYREEGRIRPAFRLISRLLKPQCPKVLEMFGSEATVAAWRPQFEEFIRHAK